MPDNHDQMTDILKQGLNACLKEALKAYEEAKKFLNKNNQGSIQDLSKKLSQQREAILSLQKEIQNTTYNINEKIEILPKKQQDAIILPEAPEIADFIPKTP